MKKSIQILLFCIIGGLVVSAVISLLILAHKQDASWNPIGQYFSALLGALIVSCITFVLLKSQASNQNKIDAYRVVFQSKLKYYEHFYEELEKIVSKPGLEYEDEKKLQFLAASLAMHITEDDLREISHCIKHIVLKKKNDTCLEKTIWHEVLTISGIMHRNLYSDNQLRYKAANFECMCNLRVIDRLEKEPCRQLLSQIECDLASYHFHSYVDGKSLFVTIPILKEYLRKQRRWGKILFIKISDAFGGPELSYRTFISQLKIVEYHKESGTYDATITLSLRDGSFSDYANHAVWNQIPNVSVDESSGDFFIIIRDADKECILRRQFDMLNLTADMWADAERIVYNLDENGRLIEQRPLGSLNNKLNI